MPNTHVIRICSRYVYTLAGKKPKVFVRECIGLANHSPPADTWTRKNLYTPRRNVIKSTARSRKQTSLATDTIGISNCLWSRQQASLHSPGYA